MFFSNNLNSISHIRNWKIVARIVVKEKVLITSGQGIESLV